MEFSKYLVIGGDIRNIYLAQLIKNLGKEVQISCFSLYDNEKKPVIQNLTDVKEAVRNAEVIIGPVPCCVNGVYLNMPLNKSNIPINDVFNNMNEKQIFIAGRISEDAKKAAQYRGIRYFDILERDEMEILNAIPTAEGAIQIAMEKTERTIHESNALVMGYGKVGKAVSKTLHSLGANTYVSARKPADLAAIRSLNYIPLPYGEFNSGLDKMDIIINTIPHVLLDGENLKFVKENCVIIDLASKPFGVDMDECRKLGINAIRALSLPGKVAPVTAASYILEMINSILLELGE